MRPGVLAFTFILAVAPLTVGGLVAQEAPVGESFRVLDPAPEGPRITPFLRHQLDRAWAQDEARRAAWETVKTEADLRQLQDITRRKLLAAVGGLPEGKTPLNARVVGTVPMEGYRIEKIVFESLPGLFVTALAYLPGGPAGPKPAVLLACGHSPLGKAYPAYQEIAARPAWGGVGGLVRGPVGLGGRRQVW